jgi:hypothetical protein
VCRISILDREIPPVLGNPDNELPCTGPRHKPNKGHSGQPGYNGLGRVPPWKGIVEIAKFQEVYCTLSLCRMTGDDLMKHCIVNLIQVLHSQRLYKNFTLHNKTRGYLRLQRRKEVLKEVDHLIDTNPDEIPQGSQDLLEMDFTSLYNASFE